MVGIRRRIVRRLAILAAGFVLARFIPSRKVRRLVILTIVPAAVTFLLERGRAYRDRRNTAL
jgi:hypothetical protein